MIGMSNITFTRCRKKKNHSVSWVANCSPSGIPVLTKFIFHHCQHTQKIQLGIDSK